MAWRGTCSIDGCEMEVRGRGWCGTHYSRWQATGDPLYTKRFGGVADIERVLAEVEEIPNGCHQWQGRKMPNGYGYINKNRKRVFVHRIAYEALVAPIPEGWHVHHRCHNTLCVNPEHLETLSPTEHIKQHRAAETHCKRGHEWTDENTAFEWRTYKGVRVRKRRCRTCLRAKWRRDTEARRKERVAANA